MYCMIPSAMLHALAALSPRSEVCLVLASSLWGFWSSCRLLKDFQDFHGSYVTGKPPGFIEHIIHMIMIYEHISRTCMDMLLTRDASFFFHAEFCDSRVTSAFSKSHQPGMEDAWPLGWIWPSPMTFGRSTICFWPAMRASSWNPIVPDCWRQLISVDLLE